MHVSLVTLYNEKTSLEVELQEIRALYEDSRKRLSEQQDQQPSTEEPEDIHQVNPLVTRVETLETESKKLLVKGKGLYGTHCKLKKEYQQLQEKSVKAEALEVELKTLSKAMQTKNNELEAKVEEQIQALQTTKSKHNELLVKMTTVQETHSIAIKKEKSRLFDLQKKYEEVKQQKVNIQTSTADLEQKINEERKTLQDEINSSNIKLASAVASTESAKSNADQDTQAYCHLPK
jgi:chromosome segregation ATPase